MALQERDIQEATRRAQEGSLTQDYIDLLKERAGRLSVAELADTTNTRNKSSIVNSRKANDKFVTTGNAQGGISGQFLDNSKDVTLDAKVRGKRGVSSKARTQAALRRQPESKQLARRVAVAKRKLIKKAETLAINNFLLGGMNEINQDTKTSELDTIDAKIAANLTKQFGAVQQAQPRQSALSKIIEGIGSFGKSDASDTEGPIPAGVRLVDNLAQPPLINNEFNNEAEARAAGFSNGDVIVINGEEFEITP